MRRPRIALAAGCLLGFLGQGCADPEEGPACRIVLDRDGGTSVLCRDGTRMELLDGAPGSACKVEHAPDGTTSVLCDDGTSGSYGDGAPAAGCTVTLEPDGSRVIRCPDGSTATVRDGHDGVRCTLHEEPGGVRTIRCDDGTELTLRDGEGGGSCATEAGPGGDVRVTCADGTTATIHPGADGIGCELVDRADGTRVVLCADGTSFVLSDGSDGAGCSVVEGAGRTMVISCGDGTGATLGPGADAEGCSFTVAADGAHLVSCPDGSEVRIPPVGDDGSISGSVALLGRGPHAGVSVRIEGTPAAATTVADGTFELASVPAGVHHLLFEAPGYAPQRLPNVLVLGGTTRLPELVLRMARLVDSGGELSRGPASPSGDTLVYSKNGRLRLHDLATGSSTELGRGQDPAYSSDGALVFFADGEQLHLFDVRTGVSRTVGGPPLHPGWRLSADARFVLQLEPGAASDLGTLLALEVATGARTQLGTDVLFGSLTLTGDPAVARFLAGYSRASYSGELVLRNLATGLETRHGTTLDGCIRTDPAALHLAALRNRAGSYGELVLIDVATGAETLLASAGRWCAFDFSADGGQLYFDDAGSVVMLHDLSLGASEPIAAGTFSGYRPAAGAVLYDDNEDPVARTGDARAYFPASGSRVLIEEALPWAGRVHSPFPPDRSLVAFVRVDDVALGTGELVVRTLATSAETVVGAGVHGMTVRFSPDGSRLHFVEQPEGAWGPSLLVAHDLVTGGRTVLSRSSALTYGLSLDGQLLLFTEASPRAFSGALFLWSFAGQTTVRLGDAAWHQGFQPDQDRLLFWDRVSAYEPAPVPDLVYYDVLGGSLRLVEQEQAEYTAVGSLGVAYDRAGDGSPGNPETGLYYFAFPPAGSPSL